MSPTMVSDILNTERFIVIFFPFSEIPYVKDCLSVPLVESGIETDPSQSPFFTLQLVKLYTMPAYSEAGAAVPLVVIDETIHSPSKSFTTR